MRKEVQNVELRRAGIAEIGVIRSLAEVAFRATYCEILTPEQLDYMMEMMYSEEKIRRGIEGSQPFFLLIDGEGEVAGYCSFERSERDGFIVQKLYLLPQRQGEGLGRVMLDRLMEEIRQENGGVLPEVRLYVNRANPAYRFYLRYGFVKESSRDFEIGRGYFMNDYVMVKPCR